MRNLRFGPDQVRADGIARVADQLGAAASTSLVSPRQGGGGEDQDHDAGHQGAVFLREAAHGDLSPQGLEQQTSGGAPRMLPRRVNTRDSRSARVRSRVIPGSFLRPQIGGQLLISANSRHEARGGLRNRDRR